MQLASWNPPSEDKLLLIRQVFARLTGPLPSKCTLTFAHSFAELSRNFREKTLPYPQAPAISRRAKKTPGALVFGSRKASLLEAWLLHLERAP